MMSTCSVSLTFYQKYGIKYYSQLLISIIGLAIILKTHSAAIGLSFVTFCDLVGTFLPLKPNLDRQKSINKTQNQNKYLLGPLIASCLSTPLILYIFWINYDTLMFSSNSDVVAMILGLSLLVGGSIDASHELIHRPQFICKFISYFNLFFLQFTAYPTEHLYLHHKKVGTSQDPITSPKNKTVYSYFINALVSCYKFNFKYSKKIFAMNVAATLLYNVILLFAALNQGSGFNKVLFFSVQSYVSIFIMECVQYIQHYGLVFRKDANKQPVTELSSWNTEQNEFLNWLIFRFQRHSDHHMNAYKIYPTLDLTEKMPRFPFDFISGLIVSWIPPLWFKLINPLVDQVIQGKPVSQQHHKLVNLVFKTLRVILTIMLPLRIIEYLYLL